ncbi:MAG: TetR/AcrR family transcriptional regulator [Candidatus Binatia bacterium]|jgi:AcrR family transcriptional regulator
MDIAIDCFARYGYQATSIDRIAKTAGVTKGAIYYHFKNKEDLLFAAVTKRVGQFERRVAAHLAAVTDAAAALREVACVCLDHATKSNHRRMIVTLMVEAIDTHPRLEADFSAMMQRFREFLKSIVQRGQRAGQFRRDVKATIAAEVFAGAIIGAEIQYYQDPEKIDLAATLAAFVEQYVGWLSDTAAAAPARRHPAVSSAAAKREARRK